MNESSDRFSASGLRIGIDVGGTNTDAVLMRGKQVLAYSKQATTADVTSGVSNAISSVLAQTSLAPAEVGSVMVGTTHFVNAFVQRRELQEVAIVRVGLPMTSGIPPLVDWPDDLRTHIGEHIFMIGGGSYYTGQEYAALDYKALTDAAQTIKKRGLKAVAVSSVFAPIRPDLETKVEEILSQALDNVHITLSHQVGGIGLVERENAAVINATLQTLANKVVSALENAIESLGLNAKLYLTQNDGTLMGTDIARQYPITTCAAGPTNSIRGAAFLSDQQDAVVVDIGGTTTDVGVLSKGFARETSDAFEMGGVRTNFNMPDVVSVGLGGGTVVHQSADGELSLGPDSVGYRISQEALVFGGNTLTTTDVAVFRGQLEIGNRDLLNELRADKSERVSRLAHDIVESTVDQLKTSAANIPVILVGGGSVLIDGDLKGASKVVRPKFGTVANAIGAAIAQVGGRLKRLIDFDAEGGRDVAIKNAIQDATANAIAAGAIAETVEVVEIEELPMPYMQTAAKDVRIRVVGDLDV
ncbi:MAG: hydantoinase/oxoprolinase N-terminal domain-containing protein [Pseudomonadales bacterium]